jgi:NDP-sugar pyrophosphorylase family protein
MKAMILAAGLGTRLRPLTDTRPKALVEINGRALLEITLTRLRSFGVNEVIINVHHFADMVIGYLKSHNHFGMRIEISREDDLLLDTGGGLKKASWFFLDNFPNSSPEPFLLHNVDVISTIDLRRMLQFHNEHGALATLAVQSRESSRLLLFNDKNQLVGRAAPGGKADHATVEESVIPSEARNPGKGSACAKSDPTVSAPDTSLSLAFSGIHIISPRLLPLLTESGVFSIIDAYLRLAAQGEKILAFRADQYYWRDLGRPADLSQAAIDLQQGKL